jgi:hypothetical protein
MRQSFITRSPAGEVPFVSHDEGLPCQQSIRKNRPRQWLYRVLIYEMAISDCRLGSWPHVVGAMSQR